MLLSDREIRQAIDNGELLIEPFNPQWCGDGASVG